MGNGTGEEPVDELAKRAASIRGSRNVVAMAENHLDLRLKFGIRLSLEGARPRLLAT